MNRKLFFHKGVKFFNQLNDGFVRIPNLKNIETSEWLIQEMQTIVLNNKKDIDQEVIFFLHGGAYVIDATPFHFYTVADIIQQTDAKVVMPIYPKAPKYNFMEAYPKILEAYRQVLKETPSPDRISFLGDSAGGGLVLGLSHLLTQENLPQPKQLILLSPWVDASSQNPEMKKFEKSDTLIPSQNFLQALGFLWTRSPEQIYHPLVSPIYSQELAELPPMTIFVGSKEMVYPDIIRFRDLMREDDREIDLYLGENMIHDYMLFNTPEGKEARYLISQLI